MYCSSSAVVAPFTDNLGKFWHNAHDYGIISGAKPTFKLHVVRLLKHEI